MNSYKDFLLIEVIPAKVDVNQTVSTAVSVSKLQHQHRRYRRSAEKENSLDFDVDVVDISGDTGRFKVNNFKWFDDNVYFDIYPFFRLLFFYTISSFFVGKCMVFPKRIGTMPAGYKGYVAYRFVVKNMIFCLALR